MLDSLDDIFFIALLTLGILISVHLIIDTLREIKEEIDD